MYFILYNIYFQSKHSTNFDSLIIVCIIINQLTNILLLKIFIIKLWKSIYILIKIYFKNYIMVKPLTFYI